MKIKNEQAEESFTMVEKGPKKGTLTSSNPSLNTVDVESVKVCTAELDEHLTERERLVQNAFLKQFYERKASTAQNMLFSKDY